VVGSIIGADIYVATAISARLVGPSSLLIWIVTGIMAMVIAMSFAYCVMIHPRVGGPYAYVREVSTPFLGFQIGWALLLAEWFSLAVFPVAFAQYFVALVPGIDSAGQVALKAAFIIIVLSTNLLGTRTAGRLNDVLTVAKLSPLLLIILGGLAFLFIDPSTVATNMTPFFTGSPAGLGQAVVLIFWAYAGFELSTLPTDDVEEPEKTIPKAIALGMLVVVAFYLLTNFAVIGAVSQATLQTSSSPLIDSVRVIFSPVGLLTNVVLLVVGVGALLSILGADESGTIGTSRLAYAMSADGLLPHALSRTHPRSGTPYLALIVLCSTAFVASLLGGLSALINSSVFLLALVYLATCISALMLARRHPVAASKLRIRPWVCVLGAGLSLVLMLLVDPAQIAVSLVLLGVGVPIYVFFSPRKELKEVKEAFLSPESVARRAYRQSRRFLAFPVHLVRHLYYRFAGIEKAFVVRRNGRAGKGNQK
jgi:amino acid transporter